MMKRRYATVAVALAVGLSTISPALGGPSPTAMVADGAKSLAKRALGKSKKATRQAKRAKRLAKQNAKLIAELKTQAKGVAGIYAATESNPSLAPGVSTVIQPQCDPGDLAVTGGWFVPADVSGDVAVKAFDRWDEDEWRVYFRNTSASTAYEVIAHTYCLDQG